MIALLATVAALGCLVLGIVLDELALTWVALGLAAAVLAAIGLAARSSGRMALGDGSSSGTDSTPTSEGPVECSAEALSDAATEAPAEPDPQTRAHSAAEAAAGATDEREQQSSEGTESRSTPDTETVRIVRGRKRYHRGGCTVLVDREHDVVTLAEAAASSCTPCGRCRPQPLPAIPA